MAEPRILVLACRRVAGELSGATALPCAGRVSPGMLVEAFAAGAAGVVVAPCGEERHGCRFDTGARRAERAVQQARRVLGRLGLEAERVAVAQSAAAVAGLARTIGRLGPTGVAVGGDAAETRGLDRWMAAIAGLSADAALTPRRGDGRPAAAAPGTPAPIVLWEGCSPFADLLLDEVLGPVAGPDALGALLAGGVRARVLTDERCCGAPLLAAGRAAEFRALAGRNAARFREAGTRRVIARCPACARTLREAYPAAGVPLDAEVVLLADALTGTDRTPAPPARLAGCGDDDERAAARLWSGVPVLASTPLHDAAGWLGGAPQRKAADAVLAGLARRKAGTVAVSCPRCALALRLLGRAGAWRPGALRVLGPGAGDGVAREERR